MRILLVSTNQEKKPVPIMPLGIAYLVSPLHANGHDVKVLDFSLVRDPQKSLGETVRNYSPNIIGFSIRNIDNVSYHRSRDFLMPTCRTIRSCREATLAPIVLGGSGFSILPREIMRMTRAHFGIVSEGEHAFVRLIHALEMKKSYAEIPGLVFRKAGRLEINKPRHQEWYDDEPFANRDFLKNRYYFHHHKEDGSQSVYNVQTKRGCRFNCIYCTYPFVEGRSMRLRSPRSVASELKKLADDYGIKNIDFVDNIFNYPPDHAEAICREIKKQKISIGWSCFLHPHFLDEKLLDLMVEAGCARAEVGVDSLSKTMIKNLKKSFTVDDMYRISRSSRKKGLHFSCSLLFGGPGETLETVKETVARLEELNPSSAFGLIGIRIYPNTELHRIACSEGIIKETTNLSQARFYLSSKINEDDLKDLFLDKMKKNSCWTFI